MLVEPIDFEGFIVKNRTVIQNDPHRELLLYPSDDVLVRTFILMRFSNLLIDTHPHGVVVVGSGSAENVSDDNKGHSKRTRWRDNE